LNFSFYRVYDELIWRLFFKLESENFLEHFSKVFRNDSENLFGVFDFQSLPEEIFEFITGVLELLVEITPRQIVFVE
jgi:hypothetical protein